MTRPDVCPAPSSLRDLMRGRPGPGLLGHLQTCERCRRLVESATLSPDSDVPTDPPEGEGRQKGHVAPGSTTGPDEVPDHVATFGGYRLLRVLGEGGMGRVFEAEDRKLGRRVALKVMKSQMAAQAPHRERFLREARAVASIHSDHVVPIYQVGEEGGVPFFAMPLLEGEPLDARLSRTAPLPIAEAVRIGHEIALGLAAAHNKGLVHRDVKPANVWLEALVSGQPRARLLDFGLARGDSDGRLTVPGEVMGTPAYFSPEQASGKRVDRRTDLFSLGVILYEIITGERPYGGIDPISALSSLALETPASPWARRKDCPQALSELIMHLLEKAPEKRPSSAAEVAQRLTAMLAPGLPAAPPTLRADNVPTMHEGRGQAVDVAAPRRGRRRLTWVAVLALALALVGGLAGSAYYFTRPEKPAEEKVEPREIAKGSDRAETPPQPREKEPPKEKELTPNDAYQLGVACAEGRGVAKDEAKAAALFQQAADKGHPAAARNLGHLYRDGKGVAKDPVAAAKWYARASDAGDEDAAFALAVAYDDGEGVTKDRVQAAVHYQKASDKGHLIATYNLGVCYEKGAGVAKNQAKAIKLYTAAAKQGHAGAAYSLARLYHDGRAGAESVDGAVRWYQVAVDKGHAGAANNLGACYQTGQGVKKDASKAFELYRKAAEWGDEDGAYNLANCYEVGRGVGRDLRQALHWYKKALDAASPDTLWLDEAKQKVKALEAGKR